MVIVGVVVAFCTFCDAPTSPVDNCGDAHFCGLELLWWLPSKPPPCMHCTLVYAYMERCGTAVQQE